MQFASWIVAAGDDEYADVGEAAQPLNDWSGIESPGFDTECLAALDALLSGDTWQAALDRYEPVYVSVGDDTAVLRLTDELLAALAAIDDEVIESLAAELAAAEAFEEAGWPEERVFDLLSELAALAQLAESQAQNLFMLVRPIQSSDE